MFAWLAWQESYFVVELLQYVEHFRRAPISLWSHRPHVPVTVAALKQILSLPAWMFWQVVTLLVILGID